MSLKVSIEFESDEQFRAYTQGPIYKQCLESIDSHMENAIKFALSDETRTMAEFVRALICDGTTSKSF